MVLKKWTQMTDYKYCVCQGWAFTMLQFYNFLVTCKSNSASIHTLQFKDLFHLAELGLRVHEDLTHFTVEALAGNPNAAFAAQPLALAAGSS